MYLLIIFFPLFGFISGILFGRLLGKGVTYITTFFLFLTFILSCWLFNDIILKSSILKISLGSWIETDSLLITWAFYFDSLTSIMLVVITGISFLVHLYSIEYMAQDPHLNRFMSYLSLFTFFMLILVTANNFLQMFVGWEGVGVSSYLLINFWFTRIQANKAAIKAMLVNRVGDFFILIGLFLLAFFYNSLDYDIIFNLIPLSYFYQINLLSHNINIIDFISLMLLLGAMGKSAQIGLHVWLPDAMEGPTPVSALIHAATMVTAGVFLISRSSYIFEYSQFTLNLTVVVGSLTAFFAATTGLFQNDIKRIIAYSTCSQLGYMIFACGLSSYQVGVFHLFNHAFFKALLFLCAGSIIHSLSDEQDIRKMGGLRAILPFSYASILIGSLALTGFPFLAGFYSKDVLLEVAFSKHTYLGLCSFSLGLLGAFCTAFYSTRLLLLVFLTTTNGNKVLMKNAHESGFLILIPLFTLIVLSVTVGYTFKDLFLGFGTDFWGSAIFILPENYILTDIEFLSTFYKLLPLFVTILGAGVAYTIYVYKLESFFRVKQYYIYKFFFNFFLKKWYFDKIYNEVITQGTLFLGYQLTYQDIDRGLLERMGPSGLASGLTNISKNLKFYQSGDIFSYIYYFLLSIILILSLYLILFS